MTKNKRKEEFGNRVKRQMIKITVCLYDEGNNAVACIFDAESSREETLLEH